MATLIHDVTELQAMTADLTADYEVANDIDASATATWNQLINRGAWAPTTYYAVNDYVTYGGHSYYCKTAHTSGGSWLATNWKHTELSAGAYLGFKPIGQTSPYFTGTSDGKGYTISSLLINRPDEDDVGLFGCVEGAIIQNIILVDVNIYGENEVGALMGEAYLTDITDCHSSGIIIGESPWDYGGLIGLFGYGTVEDCSSSCTITTTYGEEAGGLVGYTWGTPSTTIFRRCYATGDVIAGEWSGGFVGGVAGYFEDCWASGNIELLEYGEAGGFMGMGAWGGGYPQFKRCYATGNVTTPGDGGGFVGWLRGQNVNNYAVAEQCFATGDVIALGDDSWDMGGFVGGTDNYVIITDCYSRGNVEGYSDVGGFAGYLDASNNITNCYSTGYVVGGTDVGGFVGYADAGASITACFWDTQTSGTVVSDGGTGKTTAQMKTRSTFIGWDFSLIWSITPFCNNGYPCLQDVTPNCALIPSIQGPQVREIIALEAIRNIEMSCMGRAYVDEEGNLTYESRYARNP